MSLLVVRRGVVGAGAAPEVAPFEPGPYAEAVLDSEPDGYWRLNEESGATAFDLSGGDLHGTYNGAVVLGEPGPTDDDDSRAVYFPGLTSAYMVIPDAAATRARRPLTFECWLRTVVGSDARAVAKRGNSNRGWGVTARDTERHLQLTFYGVADTFSAQDAFDRDTWFHVAVTCTSGGAVTYYVDAVEAGTDSVGSPNTTSIGLHSAVSLSNSGSIATATEHRQCEMATYSRVLSQAELADHVAAATSAP